VLIVVGSVVSIHTFYTYLANFVTHPFGHIQCVSRLLFLQEIRA
jgi:hypothetical protein